MVFLDECGFSLNLHRLYGWLIGGGRLFERVPMQKGHNRSVVGAYGWPYQNNPTGLWALWQRVGSWNARLFELFVCEALLPHLPPGSLPPGSVLVLDNAKIHKSQRLKTRVEEAGWKRPGGRGRVLLAVFAALLARPQPVGDGVELDQGAGARLGPARR